MPIISRALLNVYHPVDFFCLKCPFKPLSIFYFSYWFIGILYIFWTLVLCPFVSYMCQREYIFLLLCHWYSHVTEDLCINLFLHFIFFLYLLLKYNWHTMLYYFQMYKIVIWQFYTLLTAHQGKCSYHLSPHNRIAILLTIFPMLYFSSPWLIL